MHTAIAEKSVAKISQPSPIHKNSGTIVDNDSNEARFTRVTRDANTVSIVVSDTPIPQPRVSVAMTLFGDEWSPPEIALVKKRKRGQYAKKTDPEEEQVAKFRYVAVQNRLRAWDSDEVEWLHDILLAETNREMREAIEEKNFASIREKLAWYEDMTWRPFSFPVCCAIAGAHPYDVLQGIHQGLSMLSTRLRKQISSGDYRINDETTERICHLLSRKQAYESSIKEPMGNHSAAYSTDVGWQELSLH